MKTVNKLRQMGIPDDLLSQLTDNIPTTDLLNDAFVGCLMVWIIKSDVQALEFCDIMDNLIDRESSKTPIEMLRNGK